MREFDIRLAVSPHGRYSLSLSYCKICHWNDLLFWTCSSSKFETYTTLRKPVLLSSSVKETPNLMDPLDQSVLRLSGSLPEDGSRAGFRNAVFV